VILAGPGGIPVFLAGAVLVMKNSPGSRRAFAKAHKRWPKLLGPVRTLLKTREPLKLGAGWMQEAGRAAGALAMRILRPTQRRPA
jgi:hypothetical protein